MPSTGIPIEDICPWQMMTTILTTDVMSVVVEEEAAVFKRFHLLRLTDEKLQGNPVIK